jgi:hypothetical protein
VSVLLHLLLLCGGSANLSSKGKRSSRSPHVYATVQPSYRVSTETLRVVSAFAFLRNYPYGVGCICRQARASRLWGERGYMSRLAESESEL